MYEFFMWWIIGAYPLLVMVYSAFRLMQMLSMYDEDKLRTIGDIPTELERALAQPALLSLILLRAFPRVSERPVFRRLRLYFAISAAVFVCWIAVSIFMGMPFPTGP